MATRLILAAVLGLAVILLLIIRFKIPAMIAILVGAVLIGLGAGMSFEQIIDSVNDGVGNTLKGIALLVGLGSMFGAILEISGGAQSLAVTLVPGVFFLVPLTSQQWLTQLGLACAAATIILVARRIVAKRDTARA